MVGASVTVEMRVVGTQVVIATTLTDGASDGASGVGATTTVDGTVATTVVLASDGPTTMTDGDGVCRVTMICCVEVE